MNNYLFEVRDSAAANWGEQFLVAADSLREAREIACSEMGGPCHYICELSDEEAEASGLDEY